MKNELIYDKKDGFWFDTIFSYYGARLTKDAIIIDEKNINKYIEYINKEKIDKVILDLRTSGLESISFLKDISHIKYLSISGNDSVVDFSPLYELKNLKLLNIGSSSGELNINRIESLEDFAIGDLDIVKNLEEATNLKSLWFCSCSYPNLNFLSNLKNLDTLVLYNLNFTTLEGIQNLRNLKVIKLGNMRKLESISELINLSSSLKSLRIESCNKIKDYDSIKDLNELVFLNLNYIKLVPDINFISNLKKLNTFISVNANIIDGNLTALTNLEHVYIYPIRKHYYITKQGQNIKARDNHFKYGERLMGDEEIELWRRIAYQS